MPRVRQLPELCGLRGSVVNETIRFLSPDQQAEVAKVTERIITSGILKDTIQRIGNDLSRTIGGDYSIHEDGKSTTSQDAYIIIWKATAHLLFHRDYTFRCTHCNASSYKSPKSKIVKMDRRYISCPHCNHTVHNGQHVKFSKSLEDCESPITAISGSAKVEDPYAIISDPDQAKKYYAKYLNNMYRQMLNENSIAEDKSTTIVDGCADVMAVETIRCILNEHKIHHVYCSQSNPQNGCYIIQCNTICTKPEVTIKLCALASHYERYKVHIEADHKRIVVRDMVGDAPVIRVNLDVKEHISVVGQKIEADDDHATDNYYQDSDGADGPVSVDMEDTIKSIRDSLYPLARDIYDIHLDRSDTIIIVKNSSGVLYKSQICEALNCTAKQYDDAMSAIKIQMYRRSIGVKSLSVNS